MNEISVREYGRIPRKSLSTKHLRRLQRFDVEHSRSTGECIFDWGFISDIRAKNYVGVVQIPGLRIEILPKTDTRLDDTERTSPNDRVLAQSNLLYMLAFTRCIPATERDLASLNLQKMPLLEAMLRIFVERLLRELRKGIDHAYIRKEENSTFVRGKLLLSDQIRYNIARKDRVYVAYDDFIPDTWLNRIMKATCQRLIRLTKLNRTRQRLSEAILHLSAVNDVTIRRHHFRDVSLNRNAARFQELLDFCKIVLLDSAIAPAAGASPTFSLLFPMEVLFEEFIARYIWTYAEELGFTRSQIHVQAKKQRRYLLQDSDDRARFQLKPDILIVDGLKQIHLILDTKWKRLKSDTEDSKNGVRQSDLYQLYAYAHRYDSPDNILLYPKVDGVTSKSYRLAGEESKAIRVEFVDLNYDLKKNRELLLKQLKAIVPSPDTAR